MSNGGYFERRSTNSLGLGIIVAGHAVLLTAIALNPTRFGPNIHFIPQVQNYPVKDPPPPDEPLPPPRAEPRTEARTQPTEVLVDTGPGERLVLTDLPPIRPGPIEIQPPQAEPLFRQAAMDPKAISRFQPPYPSAMVRAEIEGSVTVRVLIGTDGRVGAVELVSATNPAFFDATRDHALRAWRFQPATRDGIPTESWRTMTVKFRLES